MWNSKIKKLKFFFIMFQAGHVEDIIVDLPLKNQGWEIKYHYL